MNAIPPKLFLPILILLVFAAVFLLLLAVAKPKQKEDVEGRLKRIREDEGSAKKPAPWALAAAKEGPEEPAKKDPIAELSGQLDKAFTPWAQRMVGEGEQDDLQERIDRAGRYGMRPIDLVVWQLKAAALGGFGALILGAGLFGPEPGVLALLVFAAVGGGYWYPRHALNQEGTKRRTAILRALPATLDLMTICVEAGLSLQAAMFKVVEKGRPGPLRDEIDQVLREVQLGRPRGEALKDMGRRIDLKEVNSVVLSMVQAEATGTSVAKALRIQSEVARDGRWTRAQEQAYQAPVKLSFPLVFFIFPVMFLVIFGPVALELLTDWSRGEAPAAAAEPAPLDEEASP